jgi:hypothetical protein
MFPIPVLDKGDCRRSLRRSGLRVFHVFPRVFSMNPKKNASTAARKPYGYWIDMNLDLQSDGNPEDRKLSQA